MQDSTPKEKLRKELLRKRDRIPTEVRRFKDGIIRANLYSLHEFGDAGIILYFASFRSEAETISLIHKSLSEGKTAILPKVNLEQHILELYRINNMDELIPGYMGIPEPAVCNSERLMDADESDVIIIPGAGFDISGNRIGYGAGYYDKLLSGLTVNIPLIAPAYEEQIAVLIPAEPHDIKVNIIVTDRRIIRCGNCQ